MKRFAAVITAAVAITAIQNAPADVVVFSDGTRMEGRVEKSQTSPERVVVTTSTGQIEVGLNRIRELIEESDAEDWTHIGNQFLKTKTFPSAVQYYQRALDSDASFDGAQRGMKEAEDAIAAEKAEAARQNQSVTDEELARIEKLSAARVFDQKTYTEAETSLNGILASDTMPEQSTRAQKAMRDLYLAWGFARADRLDNKGAEERYTRVLEMDPGNEEATEALLKLWRSDTTKKPQVLAAYLERLKKDPDNLEYNKVVGDLLYESQRFDEAVEPLRKAASSPRYVNQGYDRKLLASYKGAVDMQRNARDLEKAVRTYEQMVQAFPNQDTTDLTILRYQLERSKLAADDYEGRAKLIRNLQEIGLSTAAARESELILRSDPENKAAMAILRDQAQAELTQINEAMNQANFVVAREMSSQFVANQKRFADLVEAAQEIFNKADIEAKREARDARLRASEIADRGIEYYNQAVNNVRLMNDQSVRSDSRPVSYKQNAIKLSKRAIDHYNTALKIDPSLGGIEGKDLNARLRDAQNLYSGLTDRPSSLPTVRNR